ncbi:MAG: hypothetical protein MTP17_04260 [Candidatus Midichloria sp.]|nr:MAG: hypothetical protein MTP17_04260 [Candidatus Midichloria sp.]
MIEKIQMNEFDFLVFFIDLIYIMFATVICIHFASYFANFEFDHLSKNTSHAFNIVLIYSYIFFIVLVSANILHNAMHESFLNCLLSIISYTLLIITVMLFRKPIALINAAPDFILAQNSQENKASQLYDSLSFISSGIAISGILYHFYKLSLVSIFLLCISVEFSLELLFRVVMILNLTTLEKLVLEHNLKLTGTASILKLHFSLIFVALAGLVDISEDSGILIFITWLLISVILFFIIVCITFLLEKLLFKNTNIIYIFQAVTDYKIIISRFILLLSLDLAIVILLN